MPGFQFSRVYGPVPLTAVTMACWPVTFASMCDLSQPASLMENAGEAILERNATSGAHSSKTTVRASLALIRLMLPAYAPWLASGGAVWPHGATPLAG